MLSLPEVSRAANAMSRTVRELCNVVTLSGLLAVRFSLDMTPFGSKGARSAGQKNRKGKARRKGGRQAVYRDIYDISIVHMESWSYDHARAK